MTDSVSSDCVRHACPPNTTEGRTMDVEPNPDCQPAKDTSWWKEFFRPVPVPRVTDRPAAEVGPAPDPEPVVAICRFRSP